MGIRWLTKEHKPGKLASSLVIYIKSRVGIGGLRMGRKLFRTTRYDWDRVTDKASRSLEDRSVATLRAFYLRFICEIECYFSTCDFWAVDVSFLGGYLALYADTRRRIFGGSPVYFFLPAL